MNAWRLNGTRASSCQNEHERMAIEWQTSKQLSKRAGMLE